ncbi:unnamed protein product, partial [Rotaria magnacalcarata]
MMGPTSRQSRGACSCFRSDVDQFEYEPAVQFWSQEDNLELSILAWICCPILEPCWV